MAFTNAQLDADLAVIFGDLPTTATIGGYSPRGTRGVLRRDALLADEGLRQQYRFSLWVRLADIGGAVPALRSTLSIAGTPYRIINAVQADDQRLVRLDLGEQYAAR